MCKTNVLQCLTHPVFTRWNVNEIFSDATVQASVFTHRFVVILFLVLGYIEPSPRALFSRSLFQRLASLGGAPSVV